MRVFPIYSEDIKRWADSLVQVGDQNFDEVRATKQQKGEVFILKVVSVSSLPSPVAGGMILVSSTNSIAKSDGNGWTYVGGTSVV